MRGVSRERLTLPNQVLVQADDWLVVERGLGVVPAVVRAAEVVGRGVELWLDVGGGLSGSCRM